MYPGTYKGVRVRVWKLTVSHRVSMPELKRAYSRFCVAHPNIAAVLGVCIQRGGGGGGGGLHRVSSADFRRAASLPCASPLSKCTYARSMPDGSWMSGQQLSPVPHHPIPGASHALRPHTPTSELLARDGAATPTLTDFGADGLDTQSVFEDEEEAPGTPPPALAPPLQCRTPDRMSTPPPSGPHGQHAGVAGAASASYHHLHSPSLPPGAMSPTAAAAAREPHTLWVVEECFGDESLHTRLERGLLSWQQVRWCRLCGGSGSGGEASVLLAGNASKRCSSAGQR